MTSQGERAQRAKTLLDSLYWSPLEKHFGMKISTEIDDSNVYLVVRKGERWARGPVPETLDEEMPKRELVDYLYARLDDITRLVHEADWADRDRDVAPNGPLDTLVTLELARRQLAKLADSAAMRGDAAGKDAWLIAENAIAHALTSTETAAKRQVWSMKPADLANDEKILK